MNIRDRPRYTLHFKLPTGRSCPVVLREGLSISVGRDRANDLVIADVSMSRIHAVFSVGSKGFMVADQGSLNGTFVNGVRTDNVVPLRDGDLVNLGSTRVMVHSQPPSAATDTIATDLAETTVETVPLPITILVVTMRESEEIFQKLKGKRYREFLNGFASAAESLIKSHAGRLEAVLGQSLIAIWSGSQPKQVARQALQTAQLLRDVIPDAAPTDDRIDLAVAVSSGTALSQSENKNDKSNLSILGDPVREASALDHFVRRFFSESGSVVILDDETNHLVGQSFQTRSLGTLRQGLQLKSREVFILQ